MTELNLKYETSQQTNIEPSVLIDKIFLYLKNDYKILEKTDYKIVFEFNNASGMLWMSRGNRFKVVQDGFFEISGGKITLTYYIDIVFYVLFIVVGLLLAVLATPSILIISIFQLMVLWDKILTLRKSSQIMIKHVTSDLIKPITTKFKSIRFD